MAMRELAPAALGGILVAALAAGCGGPAEDAERAAMAGQRQAADGEAGADAQPVTLTDENLDAYARALAKEAEIIRRPGRGAHYGVSISAYGSDGESGEVLEAAGMTVAEYLAVQDLVVPVFTTLNFQGKIGPPRTMDLDAAPPWKERLESDPFDTLSPESAAALRRNMDKLVPPWSDIVALTAQHGQ